MKVIFLDVDGVLNAFLKNTRQFYVETNHIRVDESKVRLLSEIVRETGSVLVLHSGWRLWFDHDLHLVRPETVALVTALQKHQMVLMDKTPDMTTAEIRETKRFSLVKAKEIRAWLAEHPAVTRYLVLDDLNLHDPDLAVFQIKTDPAVGLTRQDVERAIAILNRK